MYNRADFRREMATIRKKAAENHPDKNDFMKLVAACASFSQNHTGNARRLFLRSSGLLARVGKTRGAWFAWDGQRWDTEGEPMAKHLAGQMAENIIFEMAFRRFHDDDERKSFRSFARSSGNAASARGTLEMAEVIFEEDIKTFNKIETTAHLFNAQNGTVDLRSGQIKPHDCKDKMTSIASVAYNPKATANRWNRFLLEVFGGDEELVAFVKRAVGYSLFGKQYTNNIFFLLGKAEEKEKNGSNGKSTFIKTIYGILGDYAQAVNPEMITKTKDGKGVNNDVASLFKSRLGFGAEFDRSDVMSEKMVKQLTGDDPIHARFLFKEFFTFISGSSLWFSTNHIPLIVSQDEGIWRRPVMIPFFQHFYNPSVHRKNLPEGAIPIDPNLDADLDKEKEGILAWAIEGAMEFWEAYQAGKGLDIPENLLLQREALKEDFDPLKDFTATCLTLDPNATMTAENLWLTYQAYCQKNGDGLSRTAFGRRLNDNNILVDKKESKRQGCTVRTGACLTDTGHSYLTGNAPTGQRPKILNSQAGQAISRVA